MSDVRMDRQGKSKGFGFLTFAYARSAEDAINFDGTHAIDNSRRVDVKRYMEEGAEDGAAYDDRPARGHQERRQDSNSAEGHDPQWLADVAHSIPKEYRDVDYCITCQLPSSK